MAVLPIRLKLSNAFLVVGDRPVLIDTGSPGEADKIERTLAKRGYSLSELSLILLTHAHTDHAGSAKELRARSGAPVAIHPADRFMLRRGTMGTMSPVRRRHRLLELYVNQPFDGLDADIDLSDGQRLDRYGLPGQVLHTPGHCAGSVSVLLDPPGSEACRDALVGDTLIGGFLGGMLDRHRPRLPYFADDLEALYRSLGKLRALATGKWYAGHGGPLSAQRVESLLEKLT